MTAAQKDTDMEYTHAAMITFGRLEAVTSIFFLSLMTLLVKGSGKPPAGCPKFPCRKSTTLHAHSHCNTIQHIITHSLTASDQQFLHCCLHGL